MDSVAQMCKQTKRRMQLKASVLFLARICVASLTVLISVLPMLMYASSPALETELSHIFIRRSFTIRNFYRGGRLRYGSEGQLVEKGESGFWSRDGMVEFSSVKISSDNKLIMQGKRTCVLFDPGHGEFTNVKTGDSIQIEVQLDPQQSRIEDVVPILQRILLSSRDRLGDLVPSYWKNCVSRQVERRDKSSPWECVVTDKQAVPDFSGRKVSWDIPLLDDSLHNGMRRYLLRHRVAYLSKPGVKDPKLLVAPDPIFQWEQSRTHIGTMTLVLAFTIAEDGRTHDIFIVSPIGMGLDDDAVQSLADWKFSPAICDEKPCAAHARVFFDISSTNPLQ